MDDKKLIIFAYSAKDANAIDLIKRKLDNNFYESPISVCYENVEDFDNNYLDLFVNNPSSYIVILFMTLE